MWPLNVPCNSKDSMEQQLDCFVHFGLCLLANRERWLLLLCFTSFLNFYSGHIALT